MIISFAKTTDALLAGHKTVTRREWSAAHAARVAKAFSDGRPFDAWNYSPRVKSRDPHKVATIRLTEAPYQEMSDLVEDTAGEYEAEGFAFMDEQGQQGDVDAILLDWEERRRLLWVVRFKVVPE